MASANRRLVLAVFGLSGLAAAYLLGALDGLSWDLRPWFAGRAVAGHRRGVATAVFSALRSAASIGRWSLGKARSAALAWSRRIAGCRAGLHALAGSHGGVVGTGAARGHRIARNGVVREGDRPAASRNDVRTRRDSLRGGRSVEPRRHCVRCAAGREAAAPENDCGRSQGGRVRSSLASLDPTSGNGLALPPAWRPPRGAPCLAIRGAPRRRSPRWNDSGGGLTLDWPGCSSSGSWPMSSQPSSSRATWRTAVASTGGMQPSGDPDVNEAC